MQHAGGERGKWEVDGGRREEGEGSGQWEVDGGRREREVGSGKWTEGSCIPSSSVPTDANVSPEGDIAEVEGSLSHVHDIVNAAAELRVLGLAYPVDLLRRPSLHVRLAAWSVLYAIARGR